MEHLNAEKYSLAWFKLAECVSRKEKERALGVYRLLHHSLGNDALATQLYGDLLLCFEDTQEAIEKYVQAAELYKQQNKLIETIAVYEHLIVLDDQEERYMTELCGLYAQIDMSFKIVEHIETLVKNGKQEFALEVVEKMADFLEPHVYMEISQVIMRDS